MSDTPVFIMNDGRYVKEEHFDRVEKQLAEARARLAVLERAHDSTIEEQAALCSEGQSITELVAAKDKLIEQMREALEIALDCVKEIHGEESRDYTEIKAALAAERGGRMSKTPRTDEQILHHDNGNGHPSAFVFASFARELEEELIELRARIDHLERIVDEMTEEQAALCAEDQTITELVAAKDNLIEQMREALNILVASAPPSGPLWYDSAEMKIARAALSAAERGEW